MGASDTNALDPMLANVMRGMGIDPDALAAVFDSPALDPDAPTLADVLDRLDAIDAGLDVLAEQMTTLTAAVAPVVEALRANAGKLARFGITL